VKKREREATKRGRKKINDAKKGIRREGEREPASPT
jgi:hypothetical protein